MQTYCGDDDPSWWDDEDLLMAVDLGYDESGDDKTVVVSMQLAIVHHAKKMKRAWRSELQRAKLPFFHSVDFKNIDSGIFKHLTQDERNTVLANLSGFIRARMKVGLTVWVDIEKYKAKTTQPFRSVYGAAYTHAIHMLVLAAYLCCKHLNLGFDVNILIEGGHKNSDQALKSLRDVQKINGQAGALLNILNVGTGGKKDYPILQAADMLAYSEWQKLKGGRMQIYDALHVDGSQYWAEAHDVSDELVDIAVEVDANYKAARMAWGEHKSLNM